MRQNGILHESIQIWNKFSVSTESFITLLLLGTIQQFAVYSADLLDGLDGLMVGSFMIILTGLLFILILQGSTTFIPYIAILFGILIVDLYFNIHPARFWNGGPGAMPLGFATFYIALQTDNLIPYFLMTSVIWLDMSSSAIQILSFKIRKKRVFKIAPYHHHLQAIGWEHTKVVMRIWLIVAVTTILGVYASTII
jgi:phospho-N-acetylmuramoyl-pentapeptide-transferase